jgi:ribosomal protein L11 methyltransferase
LNNEYFELTITTDEKYTDLISDIVCSISDDGVEIEKEKIIVRSENDLSPLQDQLQEILGGIEEIKASFALEKKENSDWVGAYKASIEPIEAGEFYIHPSWYEPKEAKINITIDPALAFGSGHHATTFSCLTMISKYLKPEFGVIDVGCGSGILGLACKKKGAKNIDLCDTDIQATTSAKENFELNNETFDDIWEGSAQAAKKQYDLVLANIIADVLVMISNDLKKITKENGLIVLSGILDKKTDLVIDAFKDLHLLDKILKDEWVTLVYKKEINGRK